MKWLPLFIGLLSSVLISRANDLSAGGDGQIPLIFSGGHDTDPRDRGRPVVLIAAALNVSPEVFRDAFSHVHPAHAGAQPQEADVRQNKHALLEHLGPYGATDDRLNEVSNYYRYRGWAGEMWRHVDAAGFATIAGGKIVSTTIRNPGAGYSSAPKVSVQVGPTVYLQGIVAYGKDLASNGSITQIAAAPIVVEEQDKPALVPNGTDSPPASPPPQDIPGLSPPPPSY